MRAWRGHLALGIVRDAWAHGGSIIAVPVMVWWLLASAVVLGRGQTTTTAAAELNYTFPRLRLANGTWSERRVLAGDEVREYLQIDVVFEEPVYVKVCEPHTAVYLESQQVCVDCPPGCILSNLFSRTVGAAQIVPPTGDPGDCLCGLSYEDLLLRAQGLPGDLDFSDVERRPPIVNRAPPMEPPFPMEPYSAGLWQFGELMVRAACPQTQSWPQMLRFGLNSMPVSESLWWLRRFDTAFGIEDLSWLLGNITMSFDLKRAVFFLPWRRTRNGRTKQLGPSFQELTECQLDFPFLVNGQGDPAESIPNPGTFLQEVKRPCTTGLLHEVRRQIDMVLVNLPNASKQIPRCSADWRTSYAPRPAQPPPNNTQAEAGYVPRARRRGALAYMSDFTYTVSLNTETIDCKVLRWQLKLKAHNMMERALAYTALDAVSGCWNLLESLVQYEKNTTEAITQNCEYEPDQPAFWESPCCNRRLSRDQCCAVRNTTMEKWYAVDINHTILAQRCRADPTGGVQYAWMVTAAAMSWRRRVEQDDGLAACQRTRMVHEHAHMGSYQTLERCYRDVMGHYDREAEMYMGKPCLRDSDCFTRCVKPSLPTLQRFQSLSGKSPHRRELVGHCYVPTDYRHGYVLSCYRIRAGAASLMMFTQEMNLPSGSYTASETAAYMSVMDRAYGYECLGPLAARGVAVTEEQCLASKICNWNHEVNSQQECERDDGAHVENIRFCSCIGSWCPQISNKETCVTGEIPFADCESARKFLRVQKEEPCLSLAETAADRVACDSKLHSQMLRTCLVTRCNTYDGINFYHADDVCMDVFRQGLGICLDTCRLPAGPNPLKDRYTCWLELNGNESDEDCYRLAGDGEVHWASTEELAYFSPHFPQHARPRYCSIRVWKQSQNTMEQRSLDDEANMLSIRAAQLERDAEITAMQWEAADREGEEELHKNPPPFDGCAMGLVALGADMKDTCHNRGDDCCLSPSNGTHGYCTYCNEANITVCYVGDLVEARWPRNMLYYEATIMEDVEGIDYAELSWATLDPLYSRVTWSHIRLPGGRNCHSVVDGCAAHDQCRYGEYCYSCEECRIAFGGNPPASKCAPCPTRTGGACAPFTQCEKRYDAIDGTCPEENRIPECPCKEEWSVRGEYDGAPNEASIQGCFFDITQGFRWCEVYTDDGRPLSQCPRINRIAGTERFIYWKECAPETCTECACNCSSTSCEAYNVVPVFGRPPWQVTEADPPGKLDVDLPDDLKYFMGKIAPNCSEDGTARLSGDCNFCTTCCADYCRQKAVDEFEALGDPSAPRPFDCTNTNVTGCADLPRGWMDSEGRTCNDYSSQHLCTPEGDYGEGWTYDPPRLFNDFEHQGKIATQVCCACDGGAECADDPNGWTDPQGRTCRMYDEYNWCNRSGYGSNWSASWGSFQIGTNGKDARGACCECGGGMPLSLLETKTLLVDQIGTCRNVWPSRTVFDYPPWLPRHEYYCRFVGNVCFKKVEAKVYDPSRGGYVPDNKRNYEICEQRAYETGRDRVIEDTEVDNTPGSQSESVATELTGETVLNEEAGRQLTQLSRTLASGGARLEMDWHTNLAKGACVYQLPDPLRLAAGPNREDLPPPWLTDNATVFDPPSPYGSSGWPPEFMLALPVEGEPPDQASSKLRGILMQEFIQLFPSGDSMMYLNQWHGHLRNVECQEDDMEIFVQERYWQPGHLDDEESCLAERCHIDSTVIDEVTCEAMEGCTKSCTYCSSRSVSTLEQGLCYTTHFADAAECEGLGGIMFEENIFVETLGVPQPMRVCALPHRPLLYCVGPGEAIKRCAHYDDDHCEADPLAQLMGCALGVRQCQTRHECDLAGRCTDEDIGLTWSQPGTCVISPLDDTLLYEDCANASDLCYFRLDPAFGMEVRKRHGLMDLLGPDPPNIDYGAGAPDSMDLVGTETLGRRLRGAGRLTQEECEALTVEPGQRAIYMEASHARHKCVRWESCCLSMLGSKCELFSGPVVDAMADPTEAAARKEACALCSGDWMAVFSWEPGGAWEQGQMKSQSTQLYPRMWADANEWVNVFHMDTLRRLAENGAEGHVGKRRLTCVECLLNPLFSTLEVLAEACGAGVVGDSIEVEAESHGTAARKEAEASAKTLGYSEEMIAGVGASAASAVAMAMLPEMPVVRMPLGQITAQAGYASRGVLGGIELSWHELSASNYGMVGGPDVIYTLALEPWEASLAMAACHIAQPGRAEYVQERLELFTVQSEQATTTTLAPPPMISVNTDESDLVVGYPQWLIEDLINRFNPDLERQREAAAANAEIAEQIRREEAEAELARQAAAADASSGLTEESLNVVKGVSTPADLRSWRGTRGLGLDNETCHNVVINVVGEPIGQSVGDCVHLGANTPLTNSVELCMPASPDMTALNATPMAQLVGGVRYDFAVKDRVPQIYNITLPPELAPGISVPGELGSVMWQWRSSEEWGRLKPGFSRMFPLWLDIHWKKGGSLMCARVFEAGVTYCPVVRLDTNPYFALPQEDADGRSSVLLDSRCPQLDTLLADVQEAQRELQSTTLAQVDYELRTVQVVHPDELQYRFDQGLAAQPAEEEDGAEDGSAECPKGSCLAFKGRSFRIQPVSQGGCTFTC